MRNIGGRFMKPIDPAGFEQKFRDNIDPWDYTHSAFERFKRDVLLRACGRRVFGRVLELGCAIGETSRELAHFSLRLLAVDSSSTAIKEARRRFSGNPRIEFRRATLPGEMPRGPFDLIVVSELVYYLPAHALYPLLSRIRSALARNGRLVVLDHIRPFADAAQYPALAHGRVRAELQKSMALVFHERRSRFDVIAFHKPRL
jgi:SAM-dependent methyltransferase